MGYKAELTPLGNFAVSEKMRVSDPCYKPDVWCSGVLDTKPGVWEAAVLFLDNEATRGWGDRVAILAVKHEESEIPLTVDTINRTVAEMPVFSNGWKIADFEVGVDSGQAGFYDDSHFIARNGGDDDAWYEQMCNITLSSARAGTFSDGVVTSSGYGDGGYVCVYHMGADDSADFAYVIFILDEENETEGY